ncbi:hypothetical protein HGI30_16040 [Paenibacillus albicereus]|uniref:Uncharacterized protein n=1 Tax=Paenibacillus albicereus TaxID=2726185 RepID=A0A6H2H006_9BACL|nr:hypothetical protein [Paenibacillus albicereus]QJC52929.1 hypothetical protein HGI30_16040 [Paenibacillus albicereus]
MEPNLDRFSRRMVWEMPAPLDRDGEHDELRDEELEESYWRKQQRIEASERRRDFDPE